MNDSTSSTKCRDRHRLRGQQRLAEHYQSVLHKANDFYLQGGDSILQGLELFDLEWPNIEAGQVWSETHSKQQEAAAKL